MEKLELGDLDVASKRVLVRVDYNVPLAYGRLTDDTRIRASLETIRELQDGGARVVLVSHLGRPKGAPDPEYTLRPVATRLSELLGTAVPFAEDCIGPAAESCVGIVPDGGVCLLENLRFHVGEKRNDLRFGRELAHLAELYVNDAFGTCHRAHASMVGVAAHVAQAAAGRLLGRELAGLGRVLQRPEPPFVLIVGGAKVDDKIAVIEGLLPQLDSLLIGGAMAFTFLKAKGVAVGRSRVEDRRLDVASRLLRAAGERGVEVLLPIDHVAAPELDGDAAQTWVDGAALPSELMGLDVGAKTIASYRAAIDSSRTIVWNGPMGVFELDAFAQGTLGLARAVAKADGYTVVGGGDSVAAIKKAGVERQIDHVSTGGGASLTFLAGKPMPGLDALPGRESAR